MNSRACVLSPWSLAVDEVLFMMPYVYSKWREVYTQVVWVCMASLWASKISHSFATVNRAQSSPPKMSIKVRYLHEEWQQLQSMLLRSFESGGVCLLKHCTRLPEWIKLLQRCQSKWGTYIKKDSNYNVAHCESSSSKDVNRSEVPP